MNKTKEESVELLHNRRDYYETYYNNGNSTDLVEENEEDLLSSEHFVKHLMPVNSKNLFVFLFLLVVMNLGLAILVLIN
jgi:hypothetical protein